MNERCGHYEEALIEHGAGRLRGPTGRELEAHLAECDACRADLAVIRSVRRTAVRVPDGLEARVRAAVRDATGRAPTRQPVSEGPSRVRRLRSRVDWRAWAVPLAAAAMLAAVLVVGRDEAPGIAESDTIVEYDLYGALPGSDGFLAGEAVLSELSVEELERLLEEMES